MLQISFIALKRYIVYFILTPVICWEHHNKNLRTVIIIFQESASITDVLKESKGRGPFILHIEDNFHIIADCQSFCRSTNSSEALLNLFACIYVFNIAYNKEALNSYLFLQEYILGKADSKIGNAAIKLFAKNLEKVK